MSTFAELQTLVRQRVGAPAEDGAIGAANTGALALLVKAAVRKLDTKKPDGWNWNRVTGDLALINGQEQYGFPAVAAIILAQTVRKILTVKITVPASAGAMWTLERMSQTEAADKYPYTQPQVPQVWWAEGLNLGFRPVPDQAYIARVTAIRGEYELVNSNDVPFLPLEYHDAIVEQAAELWYRSRHNLADAQAASGAVAEWVKTMLAGERAYAGAGRVRVASTDWS